MAYISIHKVQTLVTSVHQNYRVYVVMICTYNLQERYAVVQL